MKKAFTLVELLAVIIILAIIALIAFPTVMNIINETQNDFTESQNNFVIEQAKSYISETVNDFPKIEGNTYCLTIEKLKDTNFIDTNFYDTLNDAQKSMNIEVKVSNNNYEYAINESCNREVVTVVITPEIVTGMIAIELEGTNPSDKVVKIADVNSDWYNYDEKRYANTILVTDSSRESYLNAVPGTIVNQNDILAYYVWIPSYQYQKGTSNIELINNETGSRQDSGWVTPDVFVDSNNAYTGIWLSKYEASNGDSKYLMTDQQLAENFTFLTFVNGKGTYYSEVTTPSMKSTFEALGTSNNIYGLDNVTAKMQSDSNFLESFIKSKYGLGRLPSELESKTVSISGNITGVYNIYEKKGEIVYNTDYKLDNLNLEYEEINLTEMSNSRPILIGAFPITEGLVVNENEGLLATGIHPNNNTLMFQIIASDADGDGLIFSILGEGNSVGEATLLPDSGLVTYTINEEQFLNAPEKEYYSADNFVFTARDYEGESNSYELSIKIYKYELNSLKSVLIPN